MRPLFAIVARTRNEEVFTAVALLIALVAGSATGAAGLSLTLGAFLGGMIISDSPYRVVIQSEIRPFRGLLVGFFFISVGLSLDLAVLRAAWPAVLGVALLLVVVKILTNAAASLVFGWSVPGSTQLGFLLAQGSEFAFVILSLPQVRALVGGDGTAVLIASVASSMALTPPLAMLGRVLAGRMRLHRPRVFDPEVQPVAGPGRVLIAGMGQVGRTLADALTAFGIEYAAVERDEARLRQAVADGYNVSFGDLTDPHLWEALAASAPRVLVLTAPSFETSQDLAAAAGHSFPDATRVAVVRDEGEAERFRSIGALPVVVHAGSPGFDVAASVLHKLQIGADGFAQWVLAYQERSPAEASS